jgi:hypothetical protein
MVQLCSDRLLKQLAMLLWVRVISSCCTFFLLLVTSDAFPYDAT